MSVSERSDGRGAGPAPARWSALFGHFLRVQIGLRFHGVLIVLFPRPWLPALCLGGAITFTAEEAFCRVLRRAHDRGDVERHDSWLDGLARSFSIRLSVNLSRIPRIQAKITKFNETQIKLAGPATMGANDLPVSVDHLRIASHASGLGSSNCSFPSGSHSCFNSQPTS
jgi:hypothetical protein